MGDFQRRLLALGGEVIAVQAHRGGAEVGMAPWRRKSIPYALVAGRRPVPTWTRIPQGLDLDKAKADFKDGFIEIHLPKTHKTERRQIKVD
jgi:hypothetical protein